MSSANEIEETLEDLKKKLYDIHQILFVWSSTRKVTGKGVKELEKSMEDFNRSHERFMRALRPR